MGDPNIVPLSSRILIIRTPEMRYPLIFGNSHMSIGNARKADSERLIRLAKKGSKPRTLALTGPLGTTTLQPDLTRMVT